jgi:Undecaprenyl-phosphate glucose phosphotransferase
MMLQIRMYRFFLRAATYLLVVPAFISGLGLWIVICHVLNRPTYYSLHNAVGQVLFGGVAWTLVSQRYKVTKFDELFRERTGAKNAWSACIALSFILLGTLYFTRNQSFPRALLICDIFALLAYTVVLHAIFRVLCRNRMFPGKGTRLLVIGADRFARAVGERLQRLSFAQCEVAAYLRLPGQDIAVTKQSTMELQDLSSLKGKVDEAVIAVPPARLHELPPIVAELRAICLPARAVVDLGEGIVVREGLFQLGNMQMLDLTATPTESLDYVLLKRLFDVTFSGLILVILSPLLAVIAALIKLTSPGPVFFRQERVGLSGKTFQMYKFRSMRVSAKTDSDTKWTRESDPRVTSFGAFLRKTSLDELPQFINVLKGDMSVVGPRPERPHFVHKFLNEVSSYNIRHSLRVGITGWAQVNGWRGDTSIEKRIEYDLYYLQNWSFSFDMRIIVMTLFTSLIAKNAY